MLRTILPYLVIYPAALLCFSPLKGHLKHSPERTAPAILALVTGVCLLCGSLELHFPLTNDNLLLPLVFLVCFWGLYACAALPVPQLLAIFSTITVLFAILSNLAGCFAAAIELRWHPGWAPLFPLIQLGLGFLAVLLLWYPLSHYTSQLILLPVRPLVWYTSVAFSAVVLGVNLLLMPLGYAVSGDSRQVLHMALVMVGMLLIWIMTQVSLNVMLRTMANAAKSEVRASLLSLKEEQFSSQMRFLKESARARHDFRQSIHTLCELYDAGDSEALGRYLHEYADALPNSEHRFFCANPALNALLNYYQHIALQNGIRFSLKVKLPDSLPLPDVDLCSMVGNILENAINSCLKVEDRVIRFSILIEDEQLYLVATNSFDGKPRQKAGRYVSTFHAGDALGLRSVSAVAESYGGFALFSHEGKRFLSSVAIPLPEETPE